VEPKIRVWVVFGKQLKLGAGRAQLLRLIDERGSLRKAAAEFGMSYRNAWGYLQELEQAAGFRFVERTSGAGPRSGMRLTPAGRDFLARYAKFRGGLEEATRRHFAGAFRGKELRTRTRSPERSARGRAAAR
jgi:molybdate transport system regulatory protein